MLTETINHYYRYLVLSSSAWHRELRNISLPDPETSSVASSCYPDWTWPGVLSPRIHLSVSVPSSLLSATEETSEILSIVTGLNQNEELCGLWSSYFILCITMFPSRFSRINIYIDSEANGLLYKSFAYTVRSFCL